MPNTERNTKRILRDGVSERQLRKMEKAHRERKMNEICGIINHGGRYGEPIACGYLVGHEGAHSWASLPTFVNGEINMGTFGGSSKQTLLTDDEFIKQHTWNSIYLAKTITTLGDELEKANSLLRSAYAIASREGTETNWEAFTAQLEKALEREREIMRQHGIKPKAAAFLTNQDEVAA